MVRTNKFSHGNAKIVFRTLFVTLFGGIFGVQIKNLTLAKFLKRLNYPTDQLSEFNSPGRFRRLGAVGDSGF